MIKLYYGSDEIELKELNFPDGTWKIDVHCPMVYDHVSFVWKYEGECELSKVIYIKKHLDNKGIKSHLKLSYVPNARMDRVKESWEVFTLKWFCETINWLNFESVLVLDPHSNVCTALLDRVYQGDINLIYYMIESIKKVAKESNIDDFEDIILYYPDKGAEYKYVELLKEYHYIPHVTGKKNRDWESGKILGLDVETYGIDLNGSTVIMIDDIISYGGSMYYSALKLKGLGVKNIYAYCSHLENSVLDKEKGTLIKLLEDGTVNKLFTTRSLFTLAHDKIEILEEKF